MLLKVACLKGFRFLSIYFRVHLTDLPIFSSSGLDIDYMLYKVTSQEYTFVFNLTSLLSVLESFAHAGKFCLLREPFKVECLKSHSKSSAFISKRLTF